MRLATIGILLDRKVMTERLDWGVNVFEAYIEEVLAHRCIPYRMLESAQEIGAVRTDILIASLTDDRDRTMEALRHYMEEGGIVVSYGGVNRMAASLGFRQTSEGAMGYAWLDSDSASPGGIPLRYLFGRLWLPAAGKPEAGSSRGRLVTGKSEAAEELGPVIREIPVGQGKLVRWSVDPIRTIVALQQGTRPVVEDGIPAPDGTGNLDEGILKADDQCEMDWTADRLVTEQGTPFFAFPYADYWREAVLSQLIGTALETDKVVPFSGLWPDGVDGVAMVSHDSDMNMDESARTTLNELKKNGIRSNWCMLEPGYSRDIYETVKSEGHELGLHYNAMEREGKTWSGESFGKQCSWVKAAAGLESIPFNKNHYTVFAGWDDLFLWCEKNGVAVDQTRGPSKSGNVGFPFGTCLPYYPIASLRERNRLFRVLEIAFLTQDMGLEGWGDTSAIAPFLETVKRVGGVAHFLFHQIHIHLDPAVRDGLRQVAESVRNAGMEFWTCTEIEAWEKHRRSMKIRSMDPDGGLSIGWEEAGEDANGKASREAVVYIPVSDAANVQEPLFTVLNRKCIKRKIAAGG